MNEKNRPNKANEKVSLEPAPEATVDANDAMMIASQRLSQVRYVFIVQIEDGIPTAHSRAALEYSDAVLMGWPDHHGATKFATPQAFQLEVVESNMNSGTPPARLQGRGSSQRHRPNGRPVDRHHRSRRPRAQGIPARL